MIRERVIVAMSGGVDSSVAAALLVEQGFEVVGVTLHLWDYPDGQEPGRCCAPEDQYDARRVADQLSIPHYTFDRRELFAREVVSPFVESYVEGRTPSPCVSCNRSVKMRELFGIATRLEARWIATGHYADVRERGGRQRLFKGTDRHKDQSYFLHMLTSAELERCRFPLGHLSKSEVREKALSLALPGATKGESQELCFVPKSDYTSFVEDRAAAKIRPGRIVDGQGRTIGEHAGLHRFTIGQRKGLGVSLGQPKYVVGIDESKNEVELGDEDSLDFSAATLSKAASFGDDVTFPLHATVKVRARHEGAPATIHRTEDGFHVRFDEPVRAVSPGQVAVLYDGDEVIGGSPIVSATRAHRTISKIEARA